MQTENKVRLCTGKKTQLADIMKVFSMHSFVPSMMVNFSVVLRSFFKSLLINEALDVARRLSSVIV